MRRILKILSLINVSQYNICSNYDKKRPVIKVSGDFIRYLQFKLQRKYEDIL